MGNVAIFKGKVAKFLAKAGILLPQRPQSERSITPENGEIAYNTTSNKVEVYENSAWVQIATAGAPDSASFINNQTSPANVTGFTLPNASSKYLVKIVRETSLGDLYETLELLAVSRGTSFQIALNAVGDETGVSLSVDTAGQIKYTSTNDPTHTAGTIFWVRQALL